MSKLRNVQFYRNNSIAGVASHAAAITAAEGVFNTQAANMKDGEFLLYRYTIDSESGTPVHTIVGVVRIEGTNKYVEIIANQDYVNAIINNLDVAEYPQANITTGTGISTLKIKGIKQVDGKIVAGSERDINIDGIYDATNNKIATQSTVTTAIDSISGAGLEVGANGVISATTQVTTDDSTNVATTAFVRDVIETLNATNVEPVLYTPNSDTNEGAKLTFKGISEVNGVIAQGALNNELQFAKVATTGTAADVAIVDDDSKFTATNVEGALQELAGEIDSIVYTGTNAIDVNTEKQISLTIPGTEKVLSQSDSGLVTTLSLIYENGTETGPNSNQSTKYIYLTGKNNTVIASIPAADFIKDGMLQSAVIDTRTIDNQSVKCLVLTWNTDAQISETVINLNEFIDSYSGVDGNPVVVNNTTNKISHATSNVTPGNYQQNADEVDTYGETFTIAKFTVDTYGHITSSENVTITMPAAQNLFAKVAGNSGERTAGSANDTLTIAGGTDVTTSVSGDTLTINHTTTYTTPTTAEAVNASAGGTLTFTVPSLTISTKGHVTAQTLTPYTVVMPKETTVAGSGCVSVASNETGVAKHYTVSVNIAGNAHVGDTAAVSGEATNLLKIDEENNLSVSDTWDCGTY